MLMGIAKTDSAVNIVKNKCNKLKSMVSSMKSRQSNGQVGSTTRFNRKKKLTVNR